MQFTIEPTGIEVPDLVPATTGEPDSACVTAMREAILAQAENGIGRHILIDHSRLVGAGWSEGDARRVGVTLAGSHGQLLPEAAIAIVAPAPVVYGSLQMILTYVEIENAEGSPPGGPTVEVFLDRAAALCWPEARATARRR